MIALLNYVKYTENIIRDEYEYEIPYNDGKKL